MMASGTSTPVEAAAYHGDVAAALLHWYDRDTGCWLAQHRLRRDWSGWDLADGSAVARATLDCGTRPWNADFDANGAPLYRWFVGGLTNAAFSECDRHILAGHGDRTAFIVDPPVLQESATPCHCSYRDLLLESSLAAASIRGLVRQCLEDQVLYGLLYCLPSPPPNLAL
jgi:acrylyl-CoA reductase (NADPH)/3-hydroxypropionyl-CoA dehydratase/3-hydroxypropionyl-CoA synthetase